MSGNKVQRIIALLLILSPWMYIPSVFKDIYFIILAVFLYISTIDLKKRREQKEKQKEGYSTQALYEYSAQSNTVA